MFFFVFLVLFYESVLSRRNSVFIISTSRIDNLDSDSFIDWNAEEHKFSWTIECSSLDSKYRNSRQSQFEIKVFVDSDSSSRSPVYDSGILKGNQTFYYASLKLQPSTRYIFNLQLWINTNSSSESVRSEDNVFHTNLDSSYLSEADWITGGNIFRTEFSAEEFSINKDGEEAELDRVYLFITGLGYYNSYINGIRVTDSVGVRLLDPSWTNFNETVLYSAYDVTKIFSTGGKTNYSDIAIGVEVGNGWYVTPGMFYYGVNATKCLKVVLQGFFKKHDGGGGRRSSFSSPDFYITSNAKNWRTTQGPILQDSVYNGETYDSRLYQKGWNEPHFKNGTAWDIPKTSTQYPLGGQNLKLQKRPPIRDDEIFNPVSIHQLNKTGEFIVDFGQNFAGVCEIIVHPALKPGTEIVLKHAEILNSDGSLYLANLRGAKATDTFIMKGGVEGETYRPTFTVHGFRFASVSGLEDSSMFSIRAFHFHSDVPKVGSILFGGDDDDDTTISKKGDREQDDEPKLLINQIQSCVRYGQQSNLMSIPTDCPQRDERLGWLADTFLSSQEAMYNYDMQSFYLGYLDEFIDAMHDRGGELPDYVPFCTRFGTSQYKGDPTWTSALIVLVEQMFIQYGDDHVLKKYYDPYLKDYVSFLDGKVHDKKMSDFYNCKYGDWCPPPPRTETLKQYTASFYWLRTISTMKKFAQILGYSEDEKEYEELEVYYRKKFMESFYHKLLKRIADNSQSAITMGLVLGVFDDDDEDLKSHFIKKLIDDIVKSQSYHVTTGIVGIRFLYPLLTELGYHDVAVSLITQKSYPSYGYMITNTIEPSTTLWEIWNAPKGSPGMDSRNHIMFGSIGGWMYDSLAGISPLKFGFEKIRVRPRITNFTMLTTGNYSNWMNVSYDSPRGMISLMIGKIKEQNNKDYKQQQQKVMIMIVGIPVNTEAVICVPIGEVSSSWTSLQKKEFEILESGEVVWKDGKLVQKTAGMIKVWESNECVDFEVGSGKFVFEVYSVSS